jgi:CubicO group peptidase (beta-lactamase class C family)
MSGAGHEARKKVVASAMNGEVAPGFESVREEFERNFAERGELGAACAVYHEGEKVVDLWGGYRARRRCETRSSSASIDDKVRRRPRRCSSTVPG